MKDITGLGEPAAALINRVSDAIGIIFEPNRIKRKARAEAEAEVERTKTIAASQYKSTHVPDQETQALIDRGLQRKIRTIVWEQANVEAILEQSLMQLPKHAQPQNIEVEWLQHFFDKASKISTEDARKLWAKVLAKEATNKETVHPRTIDVLSKLSRSDAENIRKLARICYLTYDNRAICAADTCFDDLLEDVRLTRRILGSLEEIGILSHVSNIDHVADNLVVSLKRGDTIKPLFWANGKLALVNFDSPILKTQEKVELAVCQPYIKVTQVGAEIMALIDNIDYSLLISGDHKSVAKFNIIEWVDSYPGCRQP